MIAATQGRIEGLSQIAPSGDIAAEIVYAIRDEMALTLDDVVMRRTGIGQLGPPPDETLDTVSKIMAGELGWDEMRRAREISALAPWFKTREAA